MIKGDKKEDDGWIKDEFLGCEFADKRLNKRLRCLFSSLWGGIGKSIPFACQDWSNTKAAYRFLSNDKVNEAEILSGHFQSTAKRFADSKGYVLVLHDTTTFSYKRANPELIGKTYLLKNKRWETEYKTACGMLLHASLAVTEGGLPLGLTAAKFWTRKKFKGCNALKKKINPTRVPIEKKESIRWLENLKQSTKLLGDPARCIHIGDRESDIYELFSVANTANTHFLVRTCVDRLADDGSHTISAEMRKEKAKAIHKIMLTNKDCKSYMVNLEIKYKLVKVLPPVDKKKHYSGLYLTVIHAVEREKPKDRKRIIWKLMTDLPVTSKKEAITMLDRYAMRWKIETFFKILKSGCKAEESKLRTATRIANLIALFCILSWRIFMMTMLNRLSEDITPEFIFTKTEIQLLDQLIKGKHKKIVLKKYTTKVAKLGGYLARTSDPPPGNMVMWRGMMRLTDIQLGFELGRKLMGN